MPEQLPEELSREKVPGALSKAPNINGSAPPRVRSNIVDTGDLNVVFIVPIVCITQLIHDLHIMIV